MVDYVYMNQMVYDGKADIVKQMTEEALEEGLGAKEILQEGMIAGMSVVGEDFKWNRLYVPEVLMAARAMKAGMAILKPLLSARDDSINLGTVVMGTVKGDLHDIGKNLVCMMAESAGFTVHNLGVDTDVDKFKAAAIEYKADIIGMSALLTTTMGYMKKVIEDFADDPDLCHIKMCVGGAPISQMYADEIGADGFAADASTAVELFKDLYGEMRQHAA
ncbi:MAG: corrinoid protein [SAR324 cluster bacterium]|nr:corrinoid protein [SAR324 cluster bacterium]